MGEFYDEYYRQMDAHFIRWRKITGKLKADNIIQISRGQKYKSVLEIGCGTGIIIKTLSEKGFTEKFYAVDIAESAVEYVRNQKMRGLMEAKISEASNLDYGDKSFDLAVLSHILEHLADPASALREAKRVAHFVAVEVPLEDHVLARIKLAFQRLIKGDKHYMPESKIGHVQFFNKRTALGLAESCGFRMEKSRIIYLPRRILFFNSKTWDSKIKSWAKVCLQWASRLIHFPLITVHFIMLCRSD